MALNLQTEHFGPKFESRYYNGLRREAAALFIGQVVIQNTELDSFAKLKRRRRTELQSALAEGLRPEKVRGVIDTHYVIEMKDDRLIAEDGEPIEAMVYRALDADRKLAETDEFFAPFLVQQTQHELDELHEWEAMARGGTKYNTLITFSAYREEYDDGTEETQTKLKRAAQKPYWRRGMFRIAHAQNSQVHIFNYSIDNCSLELMKAIARQELGYEFEAASSTDMLGERIPRTIDDDSWRFIAPRLVSRGDKILGQQHGGIWKHGHNPETEVRRAQAYIESQAEIIDSLMYVDQQLAQRYDNFGTYESAFQNEFYDCLALLGKRLDLGREQEPIQDYAVAVSGAGAIARTEGKVYDACGLVISGGQLEASTAQKTGFESLLRMEGKPVKCPSCDKKVVVDRKYLTKGELYCKACGYHLDVCTGRRLKSVTKTNPELVQPKKETDWQRIVREDNEAKQARRQAAELAKRQAA